MREQPNCTIYPSLFHKGEPPGLLKTWQLACELVLVGVLFFVPMGIRCRRGATFMEDHVMARVAAGSVDEFRSPLRKLVRFFQRSRDNWKSKCQDAKMQCKLMGNHVRAVEKSRAEWRCRAEKSEQRVHELELELAELKREQCCTG